MPFAILARWKNSTAASASLSARNRHPWGTHNHIVQFPGSFVELITVGEPDLIPPPNGVGFVEHMGKVVIPSSAAHGATLAFETPQQT
jgi:hypothetical protein